MSSSTPDNTVNDSPLNSNRLPNLSTEFNLLTEASVNDSDESSEDTSDDSSEVLNELANQSTASSLSEQELEDSEDSMSDDSDDTLHSPLGQPPEINLIPSETFSQETLHLIAQTVYHGSIYLALDSQVISPSTLINWLAEVDYDAATAIAYKAVCQLIRPNLQYLADGQHFLLRKPIYLTIAEFFGFSRNLLVDAGLNEQPIDGHTRDYFKTILQGQNQLNCLTNHKRCHQARIFTFRNLSPDQLNTSLANADWTEKFRYHHSLAKIIFYRLQHLAKSAPLYYQQVAKTYYAVVLLKLYSEKLLYKLMATQLAWLNQEFPELWPKERLDPILSYQELAYKIALLPTEVAGYVLGFPVHHYLPNETAIHQALQYLNQFGLNQYLEHNRQYLRESLLPKPLFAAAEEIIYANQEDVLTEKVEDYVCFDLVIYQVGQYVYRFTRPEFESLLSTKKNHWTGEWLPETILATISSRQNAAKKMALSKSGILSEIFTEILANNFPQTTEAPTSQIISMSYRDFMMDYLSRVVMASYSEAVGQVVPMNNGLALYVPPEEGPEPSSELFQV